MVSFKGNLWGGLGGYKFGLAPAMDTCFKTLVGATHVKPNPNEDFSATCFFEAVFEHRLHAQILDVSTACDLQTYSKTCRELNLGALHAQNSGGHWACLEICTEHLWFAFDIPLELSNLFCLPLETDPRVFLGCAGGHNLRFADVHSPDVCSPEG